MHKIALGLVASMTLLIANAVLPGTAVTTHADDPTLTLPSGGTAGGWTADWSAFADFWRAQAAAADAPTAVASVQAPAAAPQAAIEAPAVLDAPPSAPKSVVVPEAGAAPARLPATGTGSRRGSALPFVAMLIAAGGIASVVASRVVRARGSE